MKVLIVEDDHDIAQLVALTLQVVLPDCGIILATDGKSGLESFSNERPDLVMLDVGLPDTNGFAVCKKIRETSNVPIIMLTARDRVEDKVSGLNSGADDYIIKPFTPLEFLARVQAVLRRSRAEPDKTPDPIKPATPVPEPAAHASPERRIVDYLRSHPSGVEMSKLEQVVGLSGMAFVRVVAGLIEQGQVREKFPLLFLTEQPLGKTQPGSPPG